MSKKIQQFLRESRPDTPCLVVDLDIISNRYADLVQALQGAQIYYAMKANPAREVLSLLHTLGAFFDAASIFEIEACLDLGIEADRIAFGNTIKKQRDIARAHDYGVSLFAFDSWAELAKITQAAPGAEVFCRLQVEGGDADWPLSRKFGCEPDQVVEMMKSARDKGLIPAGVSFHVGSQQRSLQQWDTAIASCANIFEKLAEIGVVLTLLNIGGGFPASYRYPSEPVAAYAKAIKDSLTRHFGSQPLRVIAEPGRYIAGDAGIIQSEVVLVTTKSGENDRRWIFLDIGKFGGLPETLEEAIQYRITTPHDGGPTGQVVLAGPTCDEADVLYDAAGYALPLALGIGDRIQILSAGAYTATYSAVGFNGFPPLSEYYI
ncbi:MAG: type III PLP-dependent enzyme [Pseudomonadota bacterium]|nr:type III PLP-dependent enzyme [Pseudomonadota bacterium]MEC8463224.1 type III PLP-dependent enzyme [Pseudomonadota bacterium]MEC8725887.1 type III PLP-dependent enzyme [Pseudomonadota bacterium]